MGRKRWIFQRTELTLSGKNTASDAEVTLYLKEVELPEDVCASSLQNTYKTTMNIEKNISEYHKTYH